MPSPSRFSVGSSGAPRRGAVPRSCVTTTAGLPSALCRHGRGFSWILGEGAPSPLTASTGAASPHGWQGVESRGARPVVTLHGAQGVHTSELPTRAAPETTRGGGSFFCRAKCPTTSGSSQPGGMNSPRRTPRHPLHRAARAALRRGRPRGTSQGIAPPLQVCRHSADPNGHAI